MPDTKLTDLEILTQPADGDVLYIVDVDQDKSKQITFTNLIGTKVDDLSTSFILLSGNLGIDIDSIEDNIIEAQNDIIGNTSDIATLSTGQETISGNVADLSAAVQTSGTFLSTVETGTFSFGTAMTVSSASTITQHITSFNTQPGDFGLVSLSALGGLSGLQTNLYPLSANDLEFILNTRTNDDRQIVIPANTVFTYNMSRNTQ